MGLRDMLTGRHQVKGPAPDRLFAISTAYVTLQAEHQIDPVGTAAIVVSAPSAVRAVTRLTMHHTATTSATASTISA